MESVGDWEGAEVFPGCGVIGLFTKYCLFNGRFGVDNIT